jgi:fructokinase
MPRIGIDLGGTKTEGVVISDDGAIVHRQRVATPGGDYPATVEQVASLVESLEHTVGHQCTVGVGTPGAVSPASGLLRNANSVCLNNRPLDRDLATRLCRPVRIANDANCFTLSEAKDGAARYARSVFGVILGTGTGAGIVVDGRLMDGPNAICGEWGHNPLPWMRDDERPGHRCYCGKHGCIETFLSGPGLVGHCQPGSGNVIDITERASAGDPIASRCLADYHDRLARALAGVINLLDPETIVIGGGLSNIATLYDEVPKLLPDYVFSDVVLTRLVKAEHGDSSGVRGAAWLWPVDQVCDGLPG